MTNHTDPITLLEQIYDHAEGVLAEIGPDQYELSTPCTEWNVHELVNHVIGGVHFMASAVAGDDAARPAIRPDFTGSKQPAKEFRVAGGSFAGRVARRWRARRHGQPRPDRAARPGRAGDQPGRHPHPLVGPSRGDRRRSLDRPGARGGGARRRPDDHVRRDCAATGSHPQCRLRTMRRPTTAWPRSSAVSRHDRDRPVPGGMVAVQEPVLLPWRYRTPIGWRAEKRGHHVKYMLMFCDRPHDDHDDYDDGLVAKYVALQQEAERNGTFVTGAPLQGAEQRCTSPDRRG